MLTQKKKNFQYLFKVKKGQKYLLKRKKKKKYQFLTFIYLSRGSKKAKRKNKSKRASSSSSSRVSTVDGRQRLFNLSLKVKLKQISPSDEVQYLSFQTQLLDLLLRFDDIRSEVLSSATKMEYTSCLSIRFYDVIDFEFRS